MSKIKHWDEATQSWVIDGASNAANIELTNPGYVNEDGSSISVDLGFTKIDNRLHKIEHNVAWIYLNGAKGGSGGGYGPGGIDSTSYSIEIEEGTRVYTSSNTITIHLTITGGSVKKTFSVIILDDKGNTKGSYVVTGLTKTEITINNLNDATNRLTINANSGLNYANPTTLTVIAGAIKLTLSNIPSATIYPLSSIGLVILNALNSTDSDLLIVVLCNKEQIDVFEVLYAKESLFRVDSIVLFLDNAKTSNVGETFTFEIYAQGVLNDNILKSNSITFSCTIVLPNTLYILTYGINKAVPTNTGDLESLNKFVYGSSIQFTYQLTYSKIAFSYYNIYYSIIPCYFENGILIEDTLQLKEGVLNRVVKDTNQQFLFNTSSLPDDTIYNINTDLFKFIKVVMHAVSVDNSSIEDTKIFYFTLAEATTKYITATNLNNSLIAYFSPIMGVPTNSNFWEYDNRNTRFPYSNQGAVLQRYITLQGYNINSFMSLTDMLGVHLLGNSYADLNINLFSGNANEVNLFNGSGWTLSFTFRTNTNVDNSDVVVSLGKYRDLTLTAGIEIRANKVIYAVQTNQYSLNITKGDLTTVDIVGQRYVGPGDLETNPTHWFIKVYLNGVLSLVTSHTSSAIFNTDNSGTYGWYFDDFLHLGAMVINEEVSDACAVHFYDFKVYGSALSDNEIILNYISSYIYSELLPNSSPNMSTQNEMLQSNFILIGTDGNYHSILFDTTDETQYKDANTLLLSLISALAESKIPYPIVVVNLLTSDSNFLGITESKFNEDLKETVMNSRFPINIDYYTMGNATPVRIENTVGTGMKIGIQGTSSLRYNSKNYEIYMGEDDEGKSVLVLMKEDWLPENRYTLKADVMDSSHVNNVLIGKIINGLVTTEDSLGNEVAIKPLDNTPPMSISGYSWASKIKHTSEGYPCILFIKFKATGSNVATTRCMGIYNFNLGRYAYYNLGLKLLTSVNYSDTSETYPRMISSYTEDIEIEPGSPVYSMEVLENSTIAMFDLDDPNILNEGVFEFPYNSDGQGMTNLLKLLTFLASFGYNIESDRKVYIDNDWKTPRYLKIDGTWQESGRYYSSFDPVNYVKSTLDLHMNWNNMVSYYMIAIVFGLVDSMAKNLTLRSWNKSSSGDNIWYMCFYDMDTALRVNNVGAETVPYNAHLHRYYTDTSGIAEARVINHCPSISGIFNQEYSGYNTRLQEIVENCPTGSDDAKTLQSVYLQLRTSLFPDPAEFIDKYYGGQINLVGAALYNYDYYLKYLLVEKTYNPATGVYGDNTYNYSEISYLHGNGSTNVKDWFVKRIKFLDGIYGTTSRGINSLTGITNTPLANAWLDNNATFITGISNNIVTLTLQTESQIRITIATSGDANCFWIDENPKDYKVNNVGAKQVVSIYSNEYLTLLGKFNAFTWDTIGSLNFPLIKELSLRDLTNIKDDNFLKNSSNLQSLVKLDLHNLTLIDSNSNPVYKPLDIAQLLPNLEELDISNSTFNEVPLSSSSVLRILNLRNTKIKTLTYSNQPMLEDLLIDGCNELETISLSDCPKLKTITIPASVKTVYIGNCESMESLYATYTGSSRIISNLNLITISSCPNLKIIDLSGQNNEDLEVSLVGANGLEEINLSRMLTTNIEFPSKSDWTSLKKLNLSYTYIGYLNYINTTPLHTDYLDLDQFVNLEEIILNDNSEIKGIRCSQLATIKLGSSALMSCSNLEYLYGHFIISGTRVFSGCTLLKLNQERIYNSYPLLTLPLFIDNPEVCNIEFSPTLTSTEEMFYSCGSLTGNDFTMIMLLLHSGITNMSKMFNNCSSINAELKYDVFRHCPNVENLTSFLEGASIRGGIYSRTSNYNSENTNTYGTFDFTPNIRNLSYAFSGSSLEFIDTNIFAPKNINGSLVYSTVLDINYIFANCRELKSYVLADKEAIIPNGRLKSKTFFTNLRNILGFPQYMFLGCENIYMDIESEEVDGIMFDYLFHYPSTYNVRRLDSSLYSGIKLIGTIHDNVFGGRLKTDGTYRIVDFTVIDFPFENSGDGILCDLSSMGRMFEGLGTTLLQAKGVLKGLTFTDSAIPNDLFAGCTVLNNIESFFSNENLTNNGQVYEFPSPVLFRDCVSLNNVTNLFRDAHNLNIKLLGNGFKNCSLVNVSYMLSSSGVFGSIPFHLFYMEKNGIIQQTIDNITGVFENCFKLGYSKDRTLDINTDYVKNNNEYKTRWNDCVIKVPGTRIDFELDFTNFEGDDAWYIDGRDWKDINTDLENSPLYNTLYDNVFIYDELQKLALSVTLDRIEGFQNYIFPADYLRYCSVNCTMNNAFLGLSYIPNKLVDDGTGLYSLESTETNDGLRGRLPCKLFSANTGNTKFLSTFKDLLFCAFISFDSYKFNTLREPASQCRGIKYPPDLLKNNTNLLEISGLFLNTYIEPGVDINSDLLSTNILLINVSNLFRGVRFDDSEYYGRTGSYSLIDFYNLFISNTYLENVSGLFAVDNIGETDKGLLHIEESLFGMLDSSTPNNSRLTNVSSCFLNNTNLRGNIPILDTAHFTRIILFSGYVEGVNKSYISNSDVFKNSHEESWVPRSWFDE